MFPPLGGKQNQELVGLVCVFMLKREANISKNLCLFFFFSPKFGEFLPRAFRRLG